MFEKGFIKKMVIDMLGVLLFMFENCQKSISAEECTFFWKVN